MKEIWKSINDFEEYYQISNLGRIKSLDRLTRIGTTNFIKKGKILKQQQNSRGYMRITLKGKNTTKRFFIHRLVAEHFVYKPEGCNIVNHLDCNPKNNRADNLEWTTPKGNTAYMQKLERNKRTTTWINRLIKSQIRVKGKKVQGIPINGTKVLNYEYLNLVRKDGFQPSCVSCCCNKKRLTHKGYVWRFI